MLSVKRLLTNIESFITCLMLFSAKCAGVLITIYSSKTYFRCEIIWWKSCSYSHSEERLQRGICLRDPYSLSKWPSIDLATRHWPSSLYVYNDILEGRKYFEWVLHEGNYAHVMTKRSMLVLAIIRECGLEPSCWELVGACSAHWRRSSFEHCIGDVTCILWDLGTLLFLCTSWKWCCISPPNRISAYWTRRCLHNS